LQDSRRRRCAGVVAEIYPDRGASGGYYPGDPADGRPALACLADKGYYSDAFLAWLKEKGIKAVIPPKSQRKEQRDCDYWHYKERHAVECLFGKLKYFRRIAMLYEKKTIHFMGMLAFAATLLWLR
jgi:transposase